MHPGEGTLVVDLGWSTGYLQRSAITSTRSGKFAAKSRHQLARVDELWALLRMRGLTEEEAWFSTEQCLLRYLRAREWDVGQAYNAMTATFKWRFDKVRPFELLGQNMELMAPYVNVFMAGHGERGVLA